MSWGCPPGWGGWQKPGAQPAANPAFLHREQIKHSSPQSTAKPDTPGATLQVAKPFNKQPSCPSILPAAEPALHSPEQPQIWLPVFWGITSFVGMPAFPRETARDTQTVMSRPEGEQQAEPVPQGNAANAGRRARTRAARAFLFRTMNYRIC